MVLAISSKVIRSALKAAPVASVSSYSIGQYEGLLTNVSKEIVTSGLDKTYSYVDKVVPGSRLPVAQGLSNVMVVSFDTGESL